MNSCFFGLAYEFDGGVDPSVGINEGRTVVEVHKNEAGWSLYARTGTIDKATIAWNDMDGDRDSYTSGSEPACAINNNGVIVEVHKREAGDKLFSMYGKVNGTGIDWGKSEDYDGNGKRPSVGVNDHGRVVSVFQKEDDELRYRVGQVDSTNKEIDWEDPETWGVGRRPRVAINNSNYLVTVWSGEDGTSALKCRAGLAGSDSIDWGDEVDLQLEGSRPSIALTNDGFVVMVYKPDAVNMNQRTGRLNTSSKLIEWDTVLYYDDGDNPSVAAAGQMAVTLHQGQTLARLWFSTSIITDRANWMRDRLPRLGTRKIKDLFLPASHDSGMYTRGLSIVAKTQQLSIRGQLDNGIRYFDLRPKYDAGDDRFDIHHGGVEGPTLADVLEQIRDFAPGRSELIIIDFSHFEDFGTNNVSHVYDRFTAEIESALGTWMYKNKPANTRLADLTLNDYVSSTSSILVCIDDDFAIKYPKSGFWLFRNSIAKNSSLGDLRVFDQYADQMDYEDMAKDQIEKYEAYDGMCHPVEGGQVSPCDLFLLSWTCTSIVGAGVWQISKDPNRHLGQVMATLDIPNIRGFIPNLLYVDYCEYARVSDVALFANGTPFL